MTAGEPEAVAGTADLPILPIEVIGIGADGWPGLAVTAQVALRVADVVLGSGRQLDLLPPEVTARRLPLPSPLRAGLRAALLECAGQRLCVLASGDPMTHGIGGTLVAMVGIARLRVLPHPSSISLACARLGWPREDVEVVNLGGRPVEGLVRAVAPNRRIIVVGGGADVVARLLLEHGYGRSRMTVLEQLGGPAERARVGLAQDWSAVPADPLYVTAVECPALPAGPVLATVPGLPDSAYEHDGQLTKRDVRAAALARLAPQPGQLLWDVGAGAGSVAIEWMRHHPSCRAVAVERSPERAARIGRNAATLGVADLQVATGSAPAALAGLPTPDAVFVGGGVADEAVLAACRSRLGPGGRLVAHAVTVEGEALLVELRWRDGGELTRIGVDHAEPLGRFTVWRRSLMVTQWTLQLPS